MKYFLKSVPGRADARVPHRDGDGTVTRAPGRLSRLVCIQMTLRIRKEFSVTSHTIPKNLFSKVSCNNYSWACTGWVRPQGELGMTVVHPDVLRDPKKVLSDFSYHPKQLCFSKLCSIVNPGLAAIGVLPLTRYWAWRQPQGSDPKKKFLRFFLMTTANFAENFKALGLKLRP